MTTPLEAAIDLFRRLPPSNTRRNLERVIELRPELTETLLERVEQPLEVRFDPESNREFILCEYNRDGDSYRSPWTNKYHPPLPADDGAVPSARLRAVEVAANELFDSYREMYYGSAVSSVYLWDLDSGFAAAVAIRKAGESRAGQLSEGVWEAMHVVEVTPTDGGAASRYRLTSGLLVWLATRPDAETGAVPLTLSARLERRAEQEAPAADSAAHVANIGRMVEEMEGRLRSALEVTHVGKAREVLARLRPGADLHVAAAAAEPRPGARPPGGPAGRGGPLPGSLGSLAAQIAARRKPSAAD